LRSGGQVMGVLGVGFMAKSDMRSHVAFLEAAAAQAAAYLHNARLYQSLLHRSEELEASLSQLKAAESQIEAGEQRMQAIFENANDGMGLLQDGLWVEANHRILDMLGYDRQSFLSLGPVQISPALQAEGQPSRETALELMLRAREGQPQRFEWQLLRSNGTPIDCEVTLTLIPQAGPGVLLAILRDVTERRALEAQLRQAQKMEAIGRLAGGIAHDFNNLLTSVLGFADLAMMQVKKEDEVHATLANIALAGQAATRLTRQLLVFSRKQVLEPRTLDLRAELAAFLPILRSLQTESVQVEQDLGDAPLWVRSDLAQLQQMVMNLAVNARDAMPQGGRMQLRLRAGQGQPPAQAEGAGPWACLSVRDEGIGMTPELVQRLFEPFFTTKEPGKGTGLGLYTVYGILRQLKGGISVQSEPGRGSTFTLWLPVAEAPAELPAAQAPHARGAREATGRILLVEDQEPVLAMASAALAKAGFSVAPFMDPAQALRAAEQGQAFDLLVTDVIMPGLNGRELAQAVRRAQPGMKVLYISGYTRELIDPLGGLAAGEAMLAKPFTAQELMARAREALGL
jgi:PAS domain S-box-containing protein